MGVTLFLNARTDLFLQGVPSGEHRALLPAARERAKAYQEAGASGLFVPGLIDEDLIAELCATVALPVNVMIVEGAPSVSRLAALGVARVSYGPLPFLVAAKDLQERAHEALQDDGRPAASTVSPPATASAV
jgi:2-methylisocitrate lyase-like PEP mutase family enzyme